MKTKFVSFPGLEILDTRALLGSASHLRANATSKWKEFAFLLVGKVRGITLTLQRAHAGTCKTPLPLVTLLLFTLPAVAQGQFTYTTKNGTIAITGYDCSGSVVAIPETINGLPVTAIGTDSTGRFSDGAFHGCTSLTTVTLPNSVTNIGDYAFSGCWSLTSVTIPNRVTRIGDYAFQDCSSLTTVTLPNSVTRIGINPFAACTSLIGITVDPLNSFYVSVDGVLFDKAQTTLIDYPVTKAGSYTIPSSVTRIGDYAFFGCTSLTSVAIPNSVTSIGEWAFANCEGLTSVAIPNSVISIGTSAFSECSSLTSVAMPDSVTRIGEMAFYYCTSLTNITIPNRVISILPAVFYGCSSLTSVAIPKSVTSIGTSAFDGCASLIRITVDPLNTSYSSVDGVLFADAQTTLFKCPQGRSGSYSVPNSVTTINGKEPDVDERPSGAFSDCVSLTSITIPNSVTSIGWGAFSGCTSLTNVTIPNSVTSIDVEPFFGCTSLSGITVDPLNTVYSSLDGVLFNKRQTRLIEYPIQRTGSYTVPNSVTVIGEKALGDTIGAFNGCSGLTSVTIPNSVTSIGAGTFSGCSGLTNVMIGNGVTSIGLEAFTFCTSLSGIKVDPLNTVYSSLDGVVFDKGQTTLIQYPGGIAGSYTIPNSVTSIGDEAFRGCYSLTSVAIPDGITSIGDAAFEECTSLREVDFRGNAPSLGSDVFSNTIGKAFYLPGTTGWGTTFGSLPTALWKPQVQTSDASFGVKTNQFGFTIRWSSDKVVVVEASPSLTRPTWTPVATNTLVGGSFYFSDPQSNQYSNRFYRLHSQLDTLTASPTPNSLWGVVYGNGRFVVVGSGGAIVTSADGNNWILRQSGTTNGLYSIAYGNGTFVAVGETLLSSTNGVNWVQHQLGADYRLDSVTYGNDEFVALGSDSDSGISMTSVDGTNWVPHDNVPTGYLASITYGNGQFVALGGNGLMAASPDGVTWGLRNPGTTNSLWGVAFGNGQFVVLTSDSILASPDAVTWVRQSALPDCIGVSGVLYGNGLWVGVGGACILNQDQNAEFDILTSNDAVTWTLHGLGEYPRDSSIGSVAYGNGQYVAVGGAGTIMSSSDGVTWGLRSGWRWSPLAP